MPRHLWGRYDQLDPVVTLRPESDGLEVRAHDDASVVDGSVELALRPWQVVSLMVRG
jgi:hypothetical protein